MKKTVLVFGLISGAISAAMMFGVLQFADRIGFDKSVFVGYTTIILSFLMVYFGIRSYRENVGGGAITFGRAFAVGILITVISCVLYVVSWEILYYNFMPDFVTKYAAHEIEKAQAAGATAQAIQAKTEEMRQLKVALDNPFINAAYSFLEPFPVGLVITIISSLILRRKRKSSTGEPAEALAGT